MDRRVRQIAFLAGIVYFTQGALGISGLSLPLFLRNELHWSVSKIATVSSLAAFPWIFKIFYGLISDSFPIRGYRRKPYLLICSLFSMLGWLTLIKQPSTVFWVACAMSLSNLGFAAVDVVTDGLIVEHSRGPLNSFFQSIAWGARSAGSIISGIAGGWLAYHWPHKHVFLLTMCLPIFVMLCIPFIRESKHDRAPFSSAKEPLMRCLSLLKAGSMRWFIAILITLSVGSSFGIPFFFYLKETLHFKETFIGSLSSLGWGGVMVGSVVYFRFLRNVKQEQVLALAIVINAINIFSTLLVHQAFSAVLVSVIGGFMAGISMLTLMTASAAMTHKSGVEGTFFAVLMGVFNLGQIAFGYLGGKLYGHISLTALIWITGSLALCGVFLVKKVKIDRGTISYDAA